MVKHYDWDATFSRQTGTQGEFCIVAGGKSIGKTFGLRLRCVKEFVRKGLRFVEISRTNEERKQVELGYYEKLQHDGFFTDWVFKVEKHRGYIARKPHDDEKIKADDWRLITYFASLTSFHIEKRRTFTGMKRFIFDEAAIDSKDKYHNYLPNEFFILANILDSIGREQPDESANFRVYLLMNSVDLTCPYLQHLGVDKPPNYGYTFYNSKHTLLHYVEPWDAEERKANTLVGRMLANTSESAIVFDNRFSYTDDGNIVKKPATAVFAYALVFKNKKYALWIDHAEGYAYITDYTPKGTKNILALTRSDNRIDYLAVSKSHERVKMVKDFYFGGILRFSTLAIRDGFYEMLGFLGVS